MQGSRRVGGGWKPQARTFGWSAGLGSGQAPKHTALPDPTRTEARKGRGQLTRKAATELSLQRVQPQNEKPDALDSTTHENLRVTQRALPKPNGKAQPRC